MPAKRALVVFALVSGLVIPAREVAGDGYADDEPDSIAPIKPIGDGAVLVDRAATWTWRTVNAPRLVRQIGAGAIAGLDLVLGRRDDAVVISGPVIVPPAGWPLEVRDGSTGEGPFALRGDDGACDCTTELTATDAERVAVLYATTDFALAAADNDLRVLELRVRYRDGLMIWINGVEVENRGLDAPTGDKVATRTRGPDWEIFRIPAAPGLLRAGANRLSIEVRPAAGGRAPMLEVELVGRRRHGIARGPMVQRVGETTATIVVETELIAPATLSWGVGRSIDQRVDSPASKRHVIDLTGLPVHSLISYRVDAGDDQTADLTFHTAPAAKDQVRIAVYGDDRGGNQTHRALVDAIRGEAPDVVMLTGDLVLRGSDAADWDRFFAITGELVASVPYYTAIGNHDLGRSGDELRAVDEIFAFPPAPAGRPVGTYWYSYDVANVHLVFLDSNAYGRREQREWLAADLASARSRKVRAIVVACHEGPYSRGSHRGNTVARRAYVPILTKYRVDLVVSGHDHAYERGTVDGLDWIVSGGGGASLYSQACGVAGRRKCAVDDGMITYAKVHHYVMLTIDHGEIESCARRADGAEIEPCVRRKLHR